MDMQGYIDEIKLKITGGILELEMDDSTLERIVLAAFREIQRYISSTKMMTTSFSRCIDLSECNVSDVVAVYRTEGYMEGDNTSHDEWIDPMQLAQWQWLAGTGSLLNFNDYMLNYSSWNTLMQIRNSVSTDLAYRYDKSTERLYINTSYDNPEYITIEFIPRYNDVKEIVSDFWIDKLARLSVALTKVTLGRIRSRYTQSDSPWQQDGESLLEEGNAELQEIRDKLGANSQLSYPID